MAVEPVIWTLMLDGWRPATLNSLLGCHWGQRHRLKQADYQTLATACLVYGVRRPVGKRRVSMHFVLAPRERAPDPDASWKVLLDGLVAAGALVDDNRQHVELGPVSWSRGERRVSFITIEEV